MRRASSSIAAGWSPDGENSLTTWNGRFVRRSLSWRAVSILTLEDYVGPPTKLGPRSPAALHSPARGLTRRNGPSLLAGGE
jgi:hypothetical protein